METRKLLWHGSKVAVFAAILKGDSYLVDPSPSRLYTRSPLPSFLC